MRVLVYGAGAVGGLLAARLRRARHDVLLVAREADVVAIRLHGLRVEGMGDPVDVAAVDALTQGLETDAVFLTVKAPDVPAAGRELGHRLARPLPPILLLQNGLGIERAFIDGLDAAEAPVLPGTIVRAVSLVPATRVGPGQIRPGGTGEVILDSPDLPEMRASVERFRELLVGSGIPVRQVPELQREIWRKVVLNAAINPVTADHGIPNGQLARDPWRAQAESLLREAVAVAASEGFDFPEEEIEGDLWKLVRATSANRSSMLQDLDAGRPTEIDAIVGELLSRAARHAIEVPALARAYARITERVAARRGENAARGPP